MKTMTITAAVLATLAIAAVAITWSGSTEYALADARVPAQTVMPIDELTTNAANLPEQSFDAF